MAESAFPIISVDDLAAVRGFYERLGFEETYRFPPDGDPGYVTLQREEARLGITAVDSQTSADRFAYWVYVADVDAAVAQTCQAGGQLVEPAVDQPWGERVARVRDPAGNLVHLASGAG